MSKPVLFHSQKITVGWKEVIRFPDLGIQVRAKIDTGAKTSALHAVEIQGFEHQGQQWVRFTSFNEEALGDPEVKCEVPVYDVRRVRSSNGHAQQRYVIKTRMQLGALEQKIQLTLVDRSKMDYPMLLGRRAMEHHILVAPGASYLHGQP
ncbi:Uncharacterized conserved protein [Allopseudospirillum japonicum]|uniref:Uncharacterized conserved protein n=1 Tax=Allopseudospirillum japonicum TaxID=64971 RepID=A0A1H6UEB9_9GAMM|nr:ATP-dependent zinc protease [Allopseudospirillum japonicum]SEI86505.1 Uncharacterized conserved protein [Allopseudospirillum japonicum]